MNCKNCSRGQLINHVEIDKNNKRVVCYVASRHLVKDDSGLDIYCNRWDVCVMPDNHCNQWATGTSDYNKNGCFTVNLNDDEISEILELWDAEE